jgi:hypothetical protein
MMEARIEHLIEQGRKPACLIMEAAMMNLGVVAARAWATSRPFVTSPRSTASCSSSTK